MKYSMYPNPLHLIRYGSCEALPVQHKLQAGPVSLILENGTLKYMKIGKHELVRQIYAAVRNENWGTVLPHFLQYSIEKQSDTFSVHFEAEHKQGQIDFVWQGHITGEADGTIKYTMEGTARKSFLKNRIGFCVLHPMDMAGKPVEVETNAGTIQGSFPERIAPHQPFGDIVAMRQFIEPGIHMELLFEGDIFEMEDQRNWTDASFKTYCTPLGLPYPVIIQEGEKVKQAVTFKVKQEPQDSIQGNAVINPLRPSILVGNQIVGFLPDLGLIYNAESAKLNEEESRHLNELHLDHLRVELDCLQADWCALINQSAHEAEKINAKLEIEAIVGDNGEGLLELFQHLKDRQVTPARLFLYPRFSMVTTDDILLKAQNCMKELSWYIPLAGGSRLYFTEMNRARMPLERMEAAGFPLNPQVHAFDNESIVETLAVQAAILDSAKTIVGDLPLSVGPVTLHSRFIKKDATVRKSDPRQMSLLGAGWTIGSLRNLAEAGSAALTYYEITGENGIMDRQIGLFPIYHVFAEIGSFKSAFKNLEAYDHHGNSKRFELLKLTISDPLRIEAIALQKDTRIKIMIANLRNEKQQIDIEIPQCLIMQIRMLDERSAIEAMSDHGRFLARNDGGRGRKESGTGFDPGILPYRFVLELLPYAICIIDANFL